MSRPATTHRQSVNAIHRYSDVYRRLSAAARTARRSSATSDPSCTSASLDLAKPDCTCRLPIPQSQDLAAEPDSALSGSAARAIPQLREGTSASMPRYALATFHRRIRTRAFGVETNSAAVPTARRRDSRSGGAVDRARPGERLSRRTAAYLGAGDAELYVARFGGPMPAKGAQASGNRGAQSQRVDRQVSGAPRWSGARFDDKMIALLYLRDTTSASPIPIPVPRGSAWSAPTLHRPSTAERATPARAPAVSVAASTWSSP